MFVFIAHAEADQAAADELKAFLKTRGLVVETETGARGFRHLQASDVVIALWSQKSVFGAHRMMMEKRMLDAWADERLVLVKLDHGLLPVGMRDLAAIDASFASGRELSVWPQVERAAKQAMNAALVARYESTAPAAAAAPPQSPIAKMASRRAPHEGYENLPARSKRGPGGLLFGMLVLALIGVGVWLLFRPDFTLPAPTAALGVDGLGDLVLTNWQVASAVAGLGVVLVALRALGSGRPKSPRGKTAAQAAASPPPPEAAAPASAPVFISYAHADNAQVEPVVKVVEAAAGSVWIDKGGIQAGEGWAGEIVRGIKSARRVIVMCSSNAFESDHIKREVYLADRYKKPILPVFIAEAQPPEDFEYFFAGVQWLELFRLPEADRPAAIGKALGAV